MIINVLRDSFNFEACTDAACTQCSADKAVCETCQTGYYNDNGVCKSKSL